MPITTTPYGFNPSLTAGLVLWLDASDATTITQTSGNISQWRDKSTSALTATAVNNPTLVANIQNGFPGISFDGSTQYFNLGNNLNMGTNQLYIFVVSKFNSIADGAIIGKSLYGSSGARYSLVRSGGMIPLIEAGGGVVNNNGLSPDTSTSARLLNMVWDRSTIYLYQNGTSVFSVGLSDSSNLTTGNSLLIGAYQNGSGGTPPVAGLYMNGYIHEILMYLTPTSSPLGDTARQQIESYLAQKWGLTLGAGHPGLTSTVYRSTYLKNTVVKTNIARMTPFYTAFTPRQIGGLALWLDAADSSTITGNVTSVREKANNVALSVTGTVTTTTLGSKPSLNFGGSGYLSGAVNNLLTGTSFVVFKTTSANAGNWYPFFTWRDNAGQANFPGFGYIYNAGGNLIAPYTTFVGSGTPTTSVSIGNSYLTSYSWSGTTTNVGFNGATPTSGTQSAYASTETLIWIAYDNGPITTVNIGEIILYNSVLSLTQRQQVESYLAQKWGLTSSLPGSHLQYTQPAGAITTLSLPNSRITIIPVLSI
jgi:hypothetical protein